MDVVVYVTGVATHHYFVVDSQTWEPSLRAPDGSILVYEDRWQAVRAAQKAGGTTFVIGMGDDKWELFRKEERFTLVPRE